MRRIVHEASCDGCSAEERVDDAKSTFPKGWIELQINICPGNTMAHKPFHFCSWKCAAAFVDSEMKVKS